MAEISVNMKQLEISYTAGKNTEMAKPFGKLLDSFLKSKHVPGCLGGSVGYVSDFWFCSGHDLRVMTSSSTSGSVLTVEPA